MTKTCFLCNEEFQATIDSLILGGMKCPECARLSIQEQRDRIEANEQPEEDPNQNKYTCQPYGVPKCPKCLRPEDDCDGNCE